MGNILSQFKVLYNNTRFRARFFQGLTIVIVLSFFGFIISNMLENMARRGIPIGFDFLSEETNFGILQTLIPYSEVSPYIRAFWVGVLNTLVVAVAGIGLTSIFGFLAGIARLSDSWLMSRLMLTYVEIFRNLPILLQILFWNTIFRSILPISTDPIRIGDHVYLSIKSLTIPKLVPTPLFFVMVALLIVVFVAMIMINRYSVKYFERTGKGFPNIWVNFGLMAAYVVVIIIFFNQIFDVTVPVASKFGYTGGSDIILEFIVLTFSLSFYHATYIAEQVRASIESVDKGQKEAALALGLKRSFVTRIIVMPQALRSIIPPVTNQYLNLVKNSSLATAIGYPELVSVFAGTSLNQSGRAVEIMVMTMAVYLAFSLSISVLMNWYNRRMKLIER